MNWAVSRAVGSFLRPVAPTSSSLLTKFLQFRQPIRNIQKESVVRIADNTGARTAKCIHVLGGSMKKNATSGDFIVVSIPNRRLKRRLITKNIYLALLVSVRQQLRRAEGHYVRFSTNKAVLLTPQGKLLGTRTYGPIADEVRRKGLSKLVAMARSLV